MTSVVLFVLGLAGLPESLAAWNDWIGNNESVFRLILSAAALTMFYLAFTDRIHSFWFPEKVEALRVTPVAQPQSDSEKFRIAIETIFYSPNNSKWLGYFVANGDILIAARTGIFFRITNIQEQRVLLETLKLEIQTTSSEWLRLPRVEGDQLVFTDQVVFTKEDLTEGHILKPKQNWFKLGEEMWLDSKIPLRGWIFFTYPDLASYTEFLPNFRVTIRDTLGNSEVKTLTKVRSDEDSALSKRFEYIKKVNLSDFSLRGHILPKELLP